MPQIRIGVPARWSTPPTPAQRSIDRATGGAAGDALTGSSPVEPDEVSEVGEAVAGRGIVRGLDDSDVARGFQATSGRTGDRVTKRAILRRVDWSRRPPAWVAC